MKPLATKLSDGSPAPGTPWVTRGVLGIILATFFSDVGHEMVTAVLPLYLTTIGLGPAALGLMEGAADFAYSLSKLGGGVAGHHLRRKKPLVGAGYTVTAIATAAIAMVSSAFAIGALRVVAWIGRGFRSPLRDYLLADEVAPTHFGRAYGVERTADMLGAVTGPLLALGFLWLGASIPIVIAASIFPALLAAFFFIGLTRDRATPTSVSAAPASSRLPRKFWVFLVGVLLFGCGDFSRTFLIFLVAAHLGGAAVPGALTAGVLAYTVHNAVSGVAAFPAGRLGDRMAKWKVLALGYALGAATNAVLAVSSTVLVGLVAAVIGSGTYIAIEETVEKAAVAELLPREQRSLGFGILAFANALGDVVSSLYVGVLLGAGRNALAFGIATSFGLLGTAWIVIVGRRQQSVFVSP